MVERRVGSHKLLMPAVLIGHENAQERALVYYATKAILDTECRGVEFDVRLRAFGTIMGQDFVAGRSITTSINSTSNNSKTLIVSRSPLTTTVLVMSLTTPAPSIP